MLQLQLQTRLQLQLQHLKLQLHQLQLRLHYNTTTNATATANNTLHIFALHYTLHHTTSISCGWGDHCNHSKKHNSNQPPFGPSMDSFCYPCITTTHLSYSSLSLKLQPPPCVVLVVATIILESEFTFVELLTPFSDKTLRPCVNPAGGGVGGRPSNIQDTCSGVHFTNASHGNRGW